ncbi:hypothetical protein [Microcoleus sp. FACHB-672]|uniref:hypothetical protein n=1 Tax=Microcoleus sp. FACHB-672 TaxID=2692825 RepID=UPI001683356E|nr:hypothetical protein [Microcoleus sp. FACHB-672]MBD2043602.1 hypothetical protein [Microcoleus sp. FACHB-672]
MEPREFLALLAKLAAIGGMAAVVHFLLNPKKQEEEQSQQLTHRGEPRGSVPTQTIQTPPVKTPTVPQFLVLVVSAAQEEFLKSLQAKGQIDMGDGERLYEITNYLCLDSGSDFNKSVDAISNQYSVSAGEKSEYDICLVSIELNESSKGFEPNVNQLDRYDAFRNLAGLKINFLSRRLQMESYGNFEVYNR